MAKNTSILTVNSASAKIRNTRKKRAAAANVAYLITLATVVATMRTTTALVDGILETVAESLGTSFNFHIARRVRAKTPKRPKLVAQARNNVAFYSISVMGVVTMRTITAAAIGTKATVVEKLATRGNSSTARIVNAKTPR